MSDNSLKPSASNTSPNLAKRSSVLKRFSTTFSSIITPATNDYYDFEDILMTLDIPHGTTSVIPFSDVFNAKNHTVVPSSKTAFKLCIEDLIRYTIDVPRDTQESLMSNLHKSYYFMLFKIGDKKYTYNETNAVKYFHYCHKNNETPHFFVRFMHSYAEDKTATGSVKGSIKTTPGN